MQMAAQNVIELGFNVESLNAEQRKVLEMLTQVYEQAVKISDTRIQLKWADSNTQIKQAINQIKKSYDETNTSITKYNNFLSENIDLSNRAAAATAKNVEALNDLKQAFEDTAKQSASATTPNTESTTDPDLSGIKDGVSSVSDSTRTLSESIESFKKNQEEIQVNISAYLRLKDAMSQVAKEIKELQSANVSDLQSLDAKKDRLTALTQVQEEYKAQAQQLLQTIRAQAKENIATEGSYYQLQATLLQLEQTFKRLNATERNSDVGKEVLANINTVKDELKEIDAQMGDYRRNVGNYASAWNPLNNAINQIVREAPAATVSLQTFFLAISNNIPALQDAIKNQRAMNAAIKEGKAAGEVVPIWKSLASGIFSWNTALILGITLLITYGKEIAEFFKTIGKGKGQIDSAKLSMDALNEAFKDSSVKSAIQNVATLTDHVKLAKEGFVSKKAVVEEYNNTMGKTTGLVKTLGEVEQMLTKNGDAYIQMMVLKAEAQAAFTAAAEKSVEVQLIAAMPPQKALSAWDKYQTRSTNILTTLAASFLGHSKELAKSSESIYDESANRLGKKRQAEQTKQKQSEVKFLNDLGAQYEKKAAEISKTMGFNFFGDDGDSKKTKSGSDNYDPTKALLENRQNYLKALSQMNELELKDNIDKWNEIANDDKKGLEARVEAYQAANDAMLQLSTLQKEDEVRVVQTKLDQIEAIEKKSVSKRTNAEKDLVLQKTSLQEQLAVINKKYSIQDENTQITTTKNISKAVESEVNRLHELNKSILNAKGDDLGVKIETEAQKWDALSKSLKENNAETEETSKSIANAKEAAISLIELNYTYAKEGTQMAIDQAEQMQSLNEKYLSGKITVQEYTKAQKELQKVFQIEALDSQIKNITNQMDILRKSMEGLDENDTSSIQDKLKELEKQLAELNGKKVEIEISAKTEDAEKSIKKIQKLTEQIAEVSGNVTSAISDIASVGYNNQITEVENLEAAQQKRYEKEVTNINNSTLSEEQKANKLKVLEATRQAQSEANERKQKKAEADQAKFEKTINMASAVSNGAVAFTKALTAGPFIGPILAASIAAMTVAQVYKIAATKIPEYAEGTDNHPGGPAIVGEGKHKELVQTPDGNSFIADKPMLIDLPKSTKVLPLDDKIFAYESSKTTRTISEGTVRNTVYTEQMQTNQQWEIAKWQARQNAKALAKNNNRIVNNINTKIDLGWISYVNRNIYGKS